MNEDRAAGSGPGALPLPPASTTRNVSLIGTPARMPMPPFFGTFTATSGPLPGPVQEFVPEPEMTVSAEPEMVVSSEPEMFVASEPEMVVASEPELAASPEPEMASSPEPEMAVSAEPELAASAEQEVPVSAGPDLSGWFSNGLGDVSLAAEGADIDVSDSEPVFATDTSVPAELVFGGEEGVVEPAFEEDVRAMEEILAEAAPAATDFPLDAFIIPAETERLPTGVPEPRKQLSSSRDGAAGEIAARFEHVSKLLREEDVNELLRKLARGDKLDALLAGLLAGYLATHDA